jgi:hypothetical protein
LIQALHREHQRLTSLIDQARGIEALEMQAHWSRYVCVLVAGFLENAHLELFGRYAKSCSSPDVGRFVDATLKRVRNPKAGRFLETARAFNPAWEQPLSEFLDDNGRKDAIDSVMANRHLIAHGKDSDVSLARVVDYLSKCVEVLEFIEAQCQIPN